MSHLYRNHSIGLQYKSVEWFLSEWKYAFKWATLYPQPKYDKEVKTKMFSHYFAMPEQMSPQPSTRCKWVYVCAGFTSFIILL